MLFTNENTKRYNETNYNYFMNIVKIYKKKIKQWENENDIDCELDIWCDDYECYPQEIRLCISYFSCETDNYEFDCVKLINLTNEEINYIKNLKMFN